MSGWDESKISGCARVRKACFPCAVESGYLFILLYLPKIAICTPSLGYIL